MISSNILTDCVSEPGQVIFFFRNCLGIYCLLGRHNEPVKRSFSSDSFRRFIFNFRFIFYYHRVFLLLPQGTR